MNIREIVNRRRNKVQERIKTSVSDDFSLNLTYKDAQALLKEWSDFYIESNIFQHPLSIKFDNTLSVTQAKAKREPGKPYTITLGMKELSSDDGNVLVKDMNFLKAAIALYHEIGHYEDDMTSGKTKQDLTAEFWTYGNKDNYFHNWPILAYEIRAEHKGVMTAWERLRQIWPDKADDLMFKRLTERIKTSDYMIKVPDEDFQSEDQVNELFEEALKQAPDKRHSLSDGFLFSTDEIAQMMTIEPGVIHPKYAPFYLNLMHEQSGELFDRKMASLVSYIHPTRKDVYPELDFNELDPETLFGMPMPETSEEIGNRIIPQTESDLFCSIEQARADKWDYKQIGRELESAFDQMINVENITNFEI